MCPLNKKKQNTTMKVTFTDIHWRNSGDSDVFNMHAIKSITLEGMKQGIITIEGVSNTFKAPYCDLHFGGGIDHYELTTVHLYDYEYFINIAIFENKVCIASQTQSSVDTWFKNKCKNFCI